MLVAQGFDYSALPAEIANIARAVADRIKERRQLQMVAIIETGCDLLAVKKKLEHGQFLQWLQAEFAWTDRTARNYMQAAERFADKTEIISDLPPTEVYLLAAPSTPPSVRDAVVARLEAGERVEPGEVRELVRDAKEANCRVKEEAELSPDLMKKKVQQKPKAERESQEMKRCQEDAERANAELAEFMASHFGPALPEFIRLAEAAESKGVDIGSVIRLLKERDRLMPADADTANGDAPERADAEGGRAMDENVDQGRPVSDRPVGQDEVLTLENRDRQ
jgi:hypothetical protein